MDYYKQIFTKSNNQKSDLSTVVLLVWRNGNTVQCLQRPLVSWRKSLFHRKNLPITAQLVSLSRMNISLDLLEQVFRQVSQRKEVFNHNKFSRRFHLWSYCCIEIEVTSCKDLDVIPQYCISLKEWYPWKTFSNGKWIIAQNLRKLTGKPELRPEQGPGFASILPISKNSIRISCWIVLSRSRPSTISRFWSSRQSRNGYFGISVRIELTGRSYSVTVVVEIDF